MNNETQVTEQEQGSDIDYIETIKELKNSTVSKAKYEKLEAENKKLLSTLLEGGELDTAVATPEKRTSSEIRKDLFGENCDNLTNLQIAKLAVELREAVLDEGGIDPFVPQGHKILAENSDFAAAEKVAEAFQHCIEYADGDNEVFTNELMRITADIAPISTRARANSRR